MKLREPDRESNHHLGITITFTPYILYHIGYKFRFVRDLEQGTQTLRMYKVNDVLALFGEHLGPIKTDMT